VCAGIRPPIGDEKWLSHGGPNVAAHTLFGGCHLEGLVRELRFIQHWGNCAPAASLSMTQNSDWQPIETAPTDGTPVLLFHPAWDTLEIGIHYGCHPEWQQPNGDLLRMPTHWMVLPLPPPHGEDIAVCSGQY
jgi:hypothetical protein